MVFLVFVVVWCCVVFMGCGVCCVGVHGVVCVCVLRSTFVRLQKTLSRHSEPVKSHRAHYQHFVIGHGPDSFRRPMLHFAIFRVLSENVS